MVIKATSIMMDDQTWHKLKVACILNEISMGDYIQSMVEAELANPRSIKDVLALRKYKIKKKQFADLQPDPANRPFIPDEP